MNKYQRQIILPSFGFEGQNKLSDATILVIGAGGLGCPALQYLVAAGTGTIGIIDGDTVSETNLHRQILFTVNDIGKNKATIAKEKLSQLNPDVKIIAYTQNITTENALDILEKYDLVIDGSDNFPTRYLVNDACVLLNKPFVYGAVSQFEGQVAILNSGEQKINYRDLFPEIPTQGSIQNCAEAGVLGVLPGIIGTMQATEAIKFIVGFGETLENKLLTYNLLSQDLFTIDLIKNSQAVQFIPKDKSAFLNMQYQTICTTAGIEIDAPLFKKMADTATVVDVREYEELPKLNPLSHIQIPMSELEERIQEIKGDKIIFVCQHGIRSKNAMQYFAFKIGGNHELYSLKNGVVALN
ncbi:HesA/MoeB/ThiF family protein [Rhizosphaericola mali]|uniref:Molybdopterin-synthase adenylyltransferase n=1 Tax=Rhizosphaericola mali TaxID=2545455 RepID=A0A5P2G3K2_9BACT|nr:HesA/MoeB/ThiF family protein [Rhizosphaericola mali]QES88390.1 hypothetical protein E0W69_006860 [Rhizosphaericola mali]